MHKNKSSDSTVYGLIGNKYEMLYYPKHTTDFNTLLACYKTYCLRKRYYYFKKRFLICLIFYCIINETFREKFLKSNYYYLKRLGNFFKFLTIIANAKFIRTVCTFVILFSLLIYKFCFLLFKTYYNNCLVISTFYNNFSPLETQS